MTKDKLDFDVSTLEGKLAWAACIELTVTTHKDKTPYEVIDYLEDIFNKTHPEGKDYQSSR